MNPQTPRPPRYGALLLPQLPSNVPDNIGSVPYLPNRAEADRKGSPLITA